MSTTVSSDPASELENRLFEELGVKSKEDLTEKGLEKIGIERIDAATIKVYTTNPDGTLREGIKTGSVSEVLNVLRGIYGDRISDVGYKLIDDAYQSALFRSNQRRNIDEAFVWATDSKLSKTPLGQEFKRLIKGVLEKTAYQ